MISLIEGAKRQKTPNEIALNTLLIGLTVIFIVVCATLLPFSIYSVYVSGQGSPVTVTVLIALLGLPGPDDHRRPAERHRHRRHGPAHQARTSSHSPARRSRPPAMWTFLLSGQDRDHHLWQSSGRADRARGRAESRVCRRAGPPCLVGR